MTTPFKMTVAECHELCDNIEQDIEANIQHTRVLIHAEPCKNDCAGCSLVRDSRRCPGQ
jgi:divalent metal cation (Fe/Co/Zn/Cd) transporter